MSGAPDGRDLDPSQQAVETILRGYRAFVAGDLDAIESMLDPEVEWVGHGEVAAIADRADVLDVLSERLDEHYQVTVDRCIGVGDEVVVSMRFSQVELDETDERPLQSRRSFHVGRYAAVVRIVDGRVTRVVEYPHLGGALESVGLQDDNP
jgi:ketosteroid isomerase-like protein